MINWIKNRLKERTTLGGTTLSLAKSKREERLKRISRQKK